MIPQSPTPERAIHCMSRILKYDDPDVVDAVMELLASVAASKEGDKFRYEAAWAAIDYAFTKHPVALRKASTDYLGVAV
jgi:hypothetical protein